GGRDALLEIAAAEGEAVAEKLDDVVVARGVVAGRLHAVSVPWRRAGIPLSDRPRRRARPRRADGLAPLLVVREGGHARPRDRDRRRRPRRSRPALGEGRAHVAARVAPSAPRRRLLAPRSRAT